MRNHRGSIVEVFLEGATQAYLREYKHNNLTSYAQSQVEALSANKMSYEEALGPYADAAIESPKRAPIKSSRPQLPITPPRPGPRISTSPYVTQPHYVANNAASTAPGLAPWKLDNETIDRDAPKVVDEREILDDEQDYLSPPGKMYVETL